MLQKISTLGNKAGDNVIDCGSAITRDLWNGKAYTGGIVIYGVEGLDQKGEINRLGLIDYVTAAISRHGRLNLVALRDRAECISLGHLPIPWYRGRRTSASSQLSTVSFWLAR